MSNADKSRFTPGPWTTTPGRFWICSVGNNPDDPAVWSAFPIADNTPFPFGSKEADAALIAESPTMAALLEAAACPNSCTGGAFADHQGEPVQCQFCFERQALLARIGRWK